MNERELWEKYAGSEREAGECPDIIDLAAYIDGTLSESEKERVERHLSRCPECLDAVLAMKRVESEPLHLGDTAIARDVWKRMNGETKPGIGRLRVSVALQVAASVLFLLIALGGYKAGMQTYVSTDVAASDPIGEEIDEMASLFDETWDFFDGEAI